tara:strand:- start:199 stop:366 length:168 start_codon:yes stop_codon:yes gene_type:complete
MQLNILIFYSNHSKDFLRVDGVVPKKEVKLKKKCCEKYLKKGKRCKRCPCFDLLS